MVHSQNNGTTQTYTHPPDRTLQRGTCYLSVFTLGVRKCRLLTPGTCVRPRAMGELSTKHSLQDPPCTRHGVCRCFLTSVTRQRPEWLCPKSGNKPNDKTRIPTSSPMMLRTASRNVSASPRQVQRSLPPTCGSSCGARGSRGDTLVHHLPKRTPLRAGPNADSLSPCSSPAHKVLAQPKWHSPTGPAQG